MAMSADKIKELKSMIVKAKTAPINMAVCFGKKPMGAEVVTDKIRKPEALGREAKAAGETAKIAFGTLSVSGTGATFTCEKEPATGLGKHLKKFFKLNDIPVMTVEIVGPDGNVIAEGDDDEDGEGAGSDQNTASNAGNDAGAEANPGQNEDEQNEAEAQEETNTDANPARDTWLAAWADAEPKVAEAIARGGEQAAKITKLRDFLLGKVTATEFDAALKGLPMLLALLAPQATASAPPTEPAAKPLDPNDLIRRLGAIKPQLTGLPEAVGQKLTEMFQSAVGQVKAGQLAPAAAGIGQIEAALARVTEAKQNASGTQTGDTVPDPKFAGISKAVEALRARVTAKTAGDAQDAMNAILDTVAEDVSKSEAEKALAGLKRVQDGLKLQAEVDRMAPLVAQAASSGMVADVNALNNLFNMVADSVPATDHPKAMANLARVEQMIAEGATQGKSAQASEVAPEVKPLAEARLQWVSTRSTLVSELGKLEASIAKTLKAAGIEGDIQVEGALIKYIEELDARLEDAMDAVVNAPAEGREALKAKARGLVNDYQNVLQRDFFKDVDNSNGFETVAVTSTASAMLLQIATVLA